MSTNAHDRPASAAAPSGQTARRIEQLLREQLQPSELEVRDDSAAHAGHASAGGKGHFRLRIVSTSFAGLTPMQRHRRVYAVLAPLWERELHALSVEALAPEEAARGRA
jgi:BolA protein